MVVVFFPPLCLSTLEAVIKLLFVSQTVGMKKLVLQNDFVSARVQIQVGVVGNSIFPPTVWSQKSNSILPTSTQIKHVV